MSWYSDWKDEVDSRKSSKKIQRKVMVMAHPLGGWMIGVIILHLDFQPILQKN